MEDDRKKTDERFMKLALHEAEKAFDLDEVPVGAIVVCENQVIARAHNFTERLNDVTAHAEMQAITAAANFLGSKYLDKCTMYVSLEPCLMCAGALNHAHLGRLVYAASDDKSGFSKLEFAVLHPKTEIQFGLFAHESARLLKSFFKSKRD